MSRIVIASWVVVAAVCTFAAEPGKPYRLPSVDLKQRVLWGSEGLSPEGYLLLFGGQDQAADDGNPHTQIKVDGEMTNIVADLRRRNPWQPLQSRLVALLREQRAVWARQRYEYFQNLPDGEKTSASESVAAWRNLDRQLAEAAAKLTPPDIARAVAARALLAQALAKMGPSADLKAMYAAGPLLESAAAVLDCEPLPRALSPLVYVPRHKVFVLFGGDHGDCLLNDTWVFDPEKTRWEIRLAPQAPPPRANHKLAIAGDGKVVLSGGYTYASNTDYMGGQYRDLNDGEWTYNLDANEWTSRTDEKLVPSHARVYRTGRLHPEHCLDAPAPDRAGFAEFLKNLPDNTWVDTKVPRLPAMNRDWGSATLDLGRGLILRFSGGHSAHGGSDVLHYHLATNRWELPFPVEFPLGQTYTNTEYPEGWNFNRRPWVTGHTYQSYGYDPVSTRMVFTGRKDFSYVYDPARADWISRTKKPAAMNYGSAYYTLTLCPTPTALYCWTAEGKIFVYDGPSGEWSPLNLTGDKLPGSVVDNSTMTYDARRQRFLCFRKPYGDKTHYDGIVHQVSLATGAVQRLAPRGQAGAAEIPYLCQIRCDENNQVALVGGTLPPDDAGVRWTPCFDLTQDRWLKIKLTGDDPSGAKGRNVSLGLMYDPERKLFWAVDTNCRVYVLRLNVAQAAPGAAAPLTD